LLPESDSGRQAAQATAVRQATEIKILTIFFSERARVAVAVAVAAYKVRHIALAVGFIILLSFFIFHST
jgi:hypothetical protein